MIRTFFSIIILVCLCAQVSSAFAEDEVKAGVAVSIPQNQDIWAGQQVTIYLDLKTTGFSFSNPHFNLPEVDGAFLMQTDTTTIKSTESQDGDTWQVLRYPLALYPQKTGQLQIPSIGVRFSTSAGFGSESTAFDFQTETLGINVKLPPGVKQGDMLVTTTSFELDYNWQPDPGVSQPGDAVTLTVTRRAGDISAMLLPPLPVFETNGLAAYPQAPDVTDKSNRGDLVGERIDAIIWVVERAGQYDIPGIRFQWWDPDSQTLKQQIVPGMSLDISSEPAKTAITDTGEDAIPSNHTFIWIVIIMVTLAVCFLLWFAYRGLITGQTVESERFTFASLKKACKNNKKAESHFALHAWIASAMAPGTSPVTLSEFALVCSDPLLDTEILNLQKALVSSDHDWRGDKLLRALQPVRDRLRQQKTVPLNGQLAPLNP